MRRREFLGATTMGTICLANLMRPVEASALASPLPIPNGKTKTRVGKVYLGNPYPGWPKTVLDLNEEVRTFEAEFGKLAPALADIEFVEGGLVYSQDQMPGVMEKFKDVDGVLAIHLALGTGGYLHKLTELNVPVMVFTTPYAGHEWHIIAPMQRKGMKIDILPSSDFSDLAAAVRPLRAIHRMKEAKVLYLMGSEIDPAYAEGIQSKFGTVIQTIYLDDLKAVHDKVDEAEAKEDAERWIREAEKIMEPTEKQIFGASKMYLAMRDLLAQEGADAITINCLGMGLVQKGYEYPCLGFSRLSSMGLGGVCEADIKSTITHLIFLYLTGKPGFISDPVINLSNNTIIHAHCVAPIMMDGIDGEQCRYDIRCHHEDSQSVSLQVRMRKGQPMTLARLINNNIMLYSTGTIIDSPDSDRGCKTKIVTQVKNAQRILSNYSCGLHRVIFYGDHYADLRRFCGFKDIRIAMEEEEDLRDLPGLEWETYIHA